MSTFPKSALLVQAVLIAPTLSQLDMQDELDLSFERMIRPFLDLSEPDADQVSTVWVILSGTLRSHEHGISTPQLTLFGRVNVVTNQRSHQPYVSCESRCTMGCSNRGFLTIYAMTKN